MRIAAKRDCSLGCLFIIGGTGKSPLDYPDIANANKYALNNAIVKINKMRVIRGSAFKKNADQTCMLKIENIGAAAIGTGTCCLKKSHINTKGPKNIIHSRKKRTRLKTFTTKV